MYGSVACVTVIVNGLLKSLRRTYGAGRATTFGSAKLGSHTEGVTVSLGMPSAPAPVLAPRRKSRKIKVGKVEVGGDVGRAVLVRDGFDMTGHLERWYVASLCLTTT